MSLDFDEDVWMFISLAQKHNVEMLLVGGGAVNFYGYQRHSADVDFWIDTTLNWSHPLILAEASPNVTSKDSRQQTR